MWTNLLTNASDAITDRRNGATGEIRIATRQEGETVVVAITDNGTGIPPEARERIFDPFFTTKDVGKGTGLGLCIVSGIVKKHSGAIWVDSEPGRTTFEVTLPIAGRAVDGASAQPVVTLASGERPAPVPDDAKRAA